MGGGKKHVLLTLAFLTAFTLHLLLFSYAAVMPLVIQDLGISYTEAGLVFSMSTLAILFLRTPWGVLIDRAGFLGMTKVAATAIAAFALLRGFSTTYPVLLASQLVLGVGFAATIPALAKIVNQVFPERTGLATGVYAAGLPAGEIVGLSLSSWLVSVFPGDWRLVFQLYGAWSIMIALAWWIFARGYTPPAVSFAAAAASTFKDLLKVKQMWVLAALCVGTMGIYDTTLTWLPQLLALKGMGTSEAALVASMVPLGFLVSGPVVGMVSDRMGARKPLLGPLALVAGASLVLTGFGSSTALLAFTFLVGFALSGGLTLVLVATTEHPATCRFVGSSVGLVTSLGNIGTFLFPIMVGGLVDLTGVPLWPLVALGLLSAGAALLALPLKETGRCKPDY